MNFVQRMNRVVFGALALQEAHISQFTPQNQKPADLEGTAGVYLENQNDSDGKAFPTCAGPGSIGIGKMKALALQTASIIQLGTDQKE